MLYVAIPPDGRDTYRKKSIFKPRSPPAANSRLATLGLKRSGDHIKSSWHKDRAKMTTPRTFARTRDLHKKIGPIDAQGHIPSVAVRGHSHAGEVPAKTAWHSDAAHPRPDHITIAWEDHARPQDRKTLSFSGVPYCLAQRAPPSLRFLLLVLAIPEY